MSGGTAESGRLVSDSPSTAGTRGRGAPGVLRGARARRRTGDRSGAHTSGRAAPAGPGRTVGGNRRVLGAHCRARSSGPAPRRRPSSKGITNESRDPRAAVARVGRRRDAGRVAQATGRCGEPGRKPGRPRDRQGRAGSAGAGGRDIAGDPRAGGQHRQERRFAGRARGRSGERTGPERRPRQRLRAAPAAQRAGAAAAAPKLGPAAQARGR